MVAQTTIESTAMHTKTEPLRLAIVGGGISGLSTAYALMKQARPGDRPLHIDLFERKATLGGNADTVVIDLGDYIDGSGQPNPYLRWADLGVNGVNGTNGITNGTSRPQTPQRTPSIPFIL